MSRIRQPVLFLVLVSTAVLALVWYAHSELRSRSSPGHPNKVAATSENHDVLQDKHHVNISQVISQHTNQTSPQMRMNFGRARPTIYDLRIVAIGDIHGDLMGFRRILWEAGVVDKNGDWTGYVHYLVQLGDIMDRGDDTIQLFEYMEILRAQAKKLGGHVESLMGNHEYLNVMGHWKYVTAGDRESFGSEDKRKESLRSTGFIGKLLKNQYKVACRLPLHPSLGPINTDYVEDDTDGNASPLSHAAFSFVHGGLSPEYHQLTPFPSRINALGASALATLQREEDIKDEQEKALVYDRDSPLLYRAWGQNPDKELCAEVDGILQKTGTRRMIVGHTPQLDHKGISSACENKVFLVDTGLSSFYDELGGKLSALRIEYSLEPAPVSERVEDPSKQGWIERETLTAIYLEHGKEMLEYEREIVGDFALY